jgi:hypothetical protein
MHGRSLLTLLIVAILSGCQAQAAPEPPAPTEAAPTFDRARTGTLSGRVQWEGDVPALPACRFFATPTLPGGTYVSPYLPCVDAASAGVREAIIYLRGVEPRQARAWHHGPVRVEHSQRELSIHQDEGDFQTGFVRRGSEIAVLSRDREYHCLRGRGADFFAIPLPDADAVSRRRLDRAGVVELTSASGFYWMHGYLFVAEHPYYARSDERGSFVLEQVPTGTYEVVCWLPSWVVASRERDPESGLVSRLMLAAPGEQRQTVHIAAGEGSHVSFTWSRQRIEGPPVTK